MHVMTISSLLISVSYYEKKNNKDKKKKTEQSKKNHKDNATCANNLFALSLSLAQEVMASTHCWV